VFGGSSGGFLTQARAVMMSVPNLTLLSSGASTVVTRAVVLSRPWSIAIVVAGAAAVAVGGAFCWAWATAVVASAARTTRETVFMACEL